MKVCLVFSALLLCQFATSQFSFHPADNLSNPLSVLLKDYPSQFSDLKGPESSENIQTTDYDCTLPFPGALSQTITMHGAANDKDYSWQAIMTDSADFDRARNEFSHLYKEIKKTTFVINGEKISLAADYQDPSEQMQFTSIIFRLTPPKEAMQHAVVDLSMQYDINGWNISISIYNKEDFGTGREQ